MATRDLISGGIIVIAASSQAGRAMECLYRTLCLVDRPTLLIELAQEVSGKHPLRNLCGAPDNVTEYGKPLVLFGAGRFAKSVIAAWRHIGVAPAWCVDSDPTLHGKTVSDIPIRPPEELLPLGDSVLVIVAAMHTTQIHDWLCRHQLPHLFAELDGSIGCLPGHQLIARGSDFEQVWTMLADKCSRRVLLAAAKARLFQSIWFDMIGSPFLHAVAVGSQYCVRDIVSYDDQRTYVDCGAYEGDFLILLERELTEAGGGMLRAHAFEPDSVNVARLRDTLSIYGLDNVTIHQSLVGQEDILLDTPDFHNCRSGGPSTPVRMVRLDTVLPQTDIGFIKMDIEGAEVEALLGARQIVASQRPYLAVCAYHTTAHLLDVPLAINAIAPNYSLYVRHHSTNTLWETVCYARPV